MALMLHFISRKRGTNAFVGSCDANLIGATLKSKELAMPATGGEGLEKIEDMIVRAAESTAAHVRAAKAAIGTVIFGQDKVVEQALVTILSGGHALLLGVP